MSATAIDFEKVQPLVTRLINDVVNQGLLAGSALDIVSGVNLLVYEQTPLTLVLEAHPGGDICFRNAALLHQEGFEQVIDADGTLSIAAGSEVFKVDQRLHPEVFEGVLTAYENFLSATAAH